MAFFYDTPGRIEVLREKADEWVGTPFFPNGRLKQQGVSCQTFVGLLYADAGFISSAEALAIPEGPMDWGRVQKVGIIEPYLDGRSDLFASAETGHALPGDLVGYWVGGCVHHLGVVLDETFIHALRHTGVHRSRTDDASFLKRMARIWRPLDH